jgi:hypothetical protein
MGKKLTEIPFDKIYIGMPVAYEGSATVKGEVIFTKINKAMSFILIEDTNGAMHSVTGNSSGKLHASRWMFDSQKG